MGSIDNLIGLTKKDVLHDSEWNVDSHNMVNNTVEVQDVYCEYTSSKNNVLMYFDLLDKETMTMAIVKINDVDRKIKRQIKKIPNRYKEYIIGITKISSTEIAITYTHENIIKAI